MVTQMTNISYCQDYVNQMKEQMAALQLERDELAARVDQLEEVLYKADMLGFYELSHDSSVSHKEVCKLLADVRSTANNHAASLKLHDADLLERCAKSLKGFNSIIINEAAEWVSEQAAKLREEAS